MLIPRVLHRIWLGDAPIPAEHEAYWSTWAAHHPQWELRTWRDADLPRLRNQAAFDAATSPAQRADLARYEILLEHGGVYVDTDFECLKPLDGLLADVDCFAASEDGRYVSIGILGAVAGHPYLEALVAAAPAAIAANPGAKPNEQAGPYLATSVYSARADAGEPNPVIFGAALFYPYLYDEPHRRGEAFPDAYGVHHWEGSWLDVQPQRFVVNLDWEAPASATTVARVFCSAFRPGDPVELALAVAGTPDEQDGAAVSTLLAAVAPDPSAIPDVVVYGGDEVPSLAHVAALTSPGDSVAAGLEVAAVLDGLAATRAHLDGHGPKPAARSGAQLVARRPRVEPEPAFVAAAPALPAAPALHGVYVGNDRMLISTRWGGKVLASSRDLSLMPDLVATGDYDVPFTRFLQRELRQGDTVIDVGANLGLFTVLAGHLVGPGGRVVAYEATPENAALVRDNVAMNYLNDRVDVRERAASDAPGVVPFYATTRFAGNGSLLAHDEAYFDRYRVDTHERIDVQAEPLDVHLGSLDRVDLVKVDVEGAEGRVLAGMQGLMDAGVVRRVCFELVRDNSREEWDGLCELLRGRAAEGWRFATIGHDGGRRELELEHALQVGAFTQVVMER